MSELMFSVFGNWWKHERKQATEAVVDAMNKFCDECRGACCELLVVPAGGPDQRELLSAGRAVKWFGEEATVWCRCTSLTLSGLCRIYDKRPRACERAVVGDRVCRECVLSARPGLARKWGWA